MKEKLERSRPKKLITQPELLRASLSRWLIPVEPRDELTTWKRQTAITASMILAIAVAISCIRVGFFPLQQVQYQDTRPLIVLSFALLITTLWSPGLQLPRQRPHAAILLLIGFIFVVVLAFATYSVMGNFPLSVDERMVVFDMAVFSGKHLSTPLPASWAPFAKALVPGFLLNETMPRGLVSAYLPMNALLRMAFSKVLDPVIFNPLLALAGGAALLNIARRTFEEDIPACCVVLLIYALSAQMLVNAMTAYSMTAHMALNIIWLAAFLRSGRLGNAVAIVTGFVATGLHQLVFHPFFAAPFLVWRFRGGNRKAVLLYVVAYSAIMLWWVYYPLLAGHQVASGYAAPANSSFFERISTAFAERRGDTILTMYLNLLRFLAWQNLALLPLLSASTAVALRDRGLPAVLLAGILLWLLFIAIVTPFQGHGWGYRYLHPYLGSFALLAGYGYRELKSTIGQRVDGFVVSLSAVSALVTIPMLLFAASRVIAPYLALDRFIAAQSTPIVLIDTFARPTVDGLWSGNAIENVRNLPDLRNRPLRFSSRAMTPELLATLCRRGRVTLITSADQHRVGIGLNVSERSPPFEELVGPVQRKIRGCFVAATWPT